MTKAPKCKLCGTEHALGTFCPFKETIGLAATKLTAEHVGAFRRGPWWNGGTFHHGPRRPRLEPFFEYGQFHFSLDTSVFFCVRASGGTVPPCSTTEEHVGAFRREVRRQQERYEIEPPVTKPVESVTKHVGRPPRNETRMTPAERQRAYRERHG